MVRLEKNTVGVLLLVAFALIVACTLGYASHVHAAGNERTVMLDPGSVTAEVCVLVVHRSRMHNRQPIARCATPAELKELTR